MIRLVIEDTLELFGMLLIYIDRQLTNALNQLNKFLSNSYNRLVIVWFLVLLLVLTA